MIQNKKQNVIEYYSLKVGSWCILTRSLSSADFKMVVYEMNFYVGVDLVGKLLLDL